MTSSRLASTVSGGSLFDSLLKNAPRLHHEHGEEPRHRIAISMMESPFDSLEIQYEHKSMQREAREELLQGPTVTLVVLYSGTSMEHFYQREAAKGMVTFDRNRQFHEQIELLEWSNAQGRTAKRLIDLPLHALEAATSIAYSQFMTPTSQPLELHVDLGPILPGYMMEVLDWYCRSLRGRKWKDLLPDKSSLEGYDKFFYMYMYVTMRKIEMHGFADQLATSLIHHLIQEHQLTDEAWTLDFLLQHLPSDDPIFNTIASHYVLLWNKDRCSLFPEQWITIYQNYPHFAALLEKYQSLDNESNNDVQQTGEFLQDLNVDRT